MVPRDFDFEERKTSPHMYLQIGKSDALVRTEKCPYKPIPPPSRSHSHPYQLLNISPSNILNKEAMNKFSCLVFLCFLLLAHATPVINSPTSYDFKELELQSPSPAPEDIVSEDVRSITADDKGLEDDYIMFLVVADGIVISEFEDLEDAKEVLNQFPPGESPSRLILEVRNGVVQTDPHFVGDENQGNGVTDGFNKWWLDWSDIHKMVAVGTEYLVETIYLVIADGKVIGEFNDVEKAKEALKGFPSRARTPSRLVVEVVNGEVQPDPHTVGGQKQEEGVAAGFNKFWWDTDDIRRMITVGKDYIEGRLFLVVAHDEVIGEYESVEYAKAALNKFPPGAPSPSRLVLEVEQGEVQPDPHTVGGQNQGRGVAAGFNKWWRDWHDIKEMVAIGQDYMNPEN